MSPFHGVFTALVTPFKENQIDLESLGKLLRWQLDQGIQGFVVHGTTGESPTLTPSEKQKVFQFVQSYVSGQVPLIVGTGTNNTAETLEATKKARSWGADAA
ncbi:MAG: dihydrodipicolinate synthase family protein, partial [Bdellovibrionota bacterium]